MLLRQHKILINRYLFNKKLLNAVLFQVGWFACLLGGDQIALLVIGVLLLIHAVFFIEKKSEWGFVTTVVLVGFTIDSVLSLQGLFLFESPSLGYIPLWLVCLWCVFAITINHSLFWLQHRLLLASLLGAVSGPASYLAGSKLAPVILADPLISSLLIISLCWALLLPLLLVLSRRVVV